MTDLTLGAAFIDWALETRSVRALVLIGSHARTGSEPGAADESSDWDFQVVTSDSELFSQPSWTIGAGLSAPLAYVTRVGRLGHTAKVSAAFTNGELDLVLIPARQLFILKSLFKLGLSSYIPAARRALPDLAIVLKAGHRVLKGGEQWRHFFARISSEVQIPRLNDDAICILANAYVCDYISTLRKIERGEFAAAQRWLHCQLAETNFRLLHELRLRVGKVSFPDARRIEFVVKDKWGEAVTVAAVPERESLKRALGQSGRTCRELVQALIGSRWRWPLEI